MPAPGEQYCYRRGEVTFQGVSELEWRRQGQPPARDATGEEDYGGIDSFVRDEDGYRFSGDFGDLRVKAQSVWASLFWEARGAVREDCCRGRSVPMRYWQQVLEQRLDSVDKYLCGWCERGWVLSCVVVATGKPLMVCEECDSVWLNADEIVSKASPVQPHLVFPQISGPRTGILWDYVEPLDAGQPLSDWEQIKLAVDVANSPPGAEGS